MKIYAPCPTHHFGRPSISDVSLHLYNTFYRGHRLQVNCNNERKVTFPRSITHQKQGEQKAIRYPQTNAQTEWHVYLLEITGLFCWYIQVPAQNLQVPTANEATRQRNFGTDGLLGTGTRKDTWLQLPGAAHRSTTRFTPIISPKERCFSSAPYCSFMVRVDKATTATGWALASR